MKQMILIADCVATASLAMADDETDCRNVAGTFIAGTVVGGPRFKPGQQFPHGVELSHTHVTLRSDGDHQDYDVAIEALAKCRFSDLSAMPCHKQPEVYAYRRYFCSAAP